MARPNTHYWLKWAPERKVRVTDSVDKSEPFFHDGDNFEPYIEVIPGSFQTQFFPCPYRMAGFKAEVTLKPSKYRPECIEARYYPDLSFLQKSNPYLGSEHDNYLLNQVDRIAVFMREGQTLAQIAIEYPDLDTYKWPVLGFLLGKFLRLRQSEVDSVQTVSQMAELPEVSD